MRLDLYIHTNSHKPGYKKINKINKKKLQEELKKKKEALCMNERPKQNLRSAKYLYTVFLSGVWFFCICTALYRWVYACAVTHAVYCSDTRLCGEDSVVQQWLNPWDTKRSVLRKTLKRPADQRGFKLDNSLSAQQVRFLSYFRYLCKRHG